MSGKEKAILLGEGYGSVSVRGLVQSMMKEDFTKIVSRLTDEHNYICGLDEKWILDNLILLYGGGMINNKDNFGLLVHEFKDKSTLAINQNEKFYHVRGEDSTEVLNLKHITSGGVSLKFYTYMGEDVDVTGYDYIIREICRRINYRSEFVDKGLTGLANEEIFIEGTDIFVPSTHADSRNIVALLAARNPKTIKKKQSNTHIYKDTGITLDFLKEHSKEINSLFFNYGVMPNKSKLVISETDTLFNLYHNSNIPIKGESSLYNIYSI